MSGIGHRVPFELPPTSPVKTVLAATPALVGGILCARPCLDAPVEAERLGRFTALRSRGGGR